MNVSFEVFKILRRHLFAALQALILETVFRAYGFMFSLAVMFLLKNRYLNLISSSITALYDLR